MSKDPSGFDSPSGDPPQNSESSPENFLELGSGLNEAESRGGLEQGTFAAPILNPTRGEILDHLETAEEIQVEVKRHTGGFEVHETLDFLRSIGPLEEDPLECGEDETFNFEFLDDETGEFPEGEDCWLMDFEPEDEEWAPETFLEDLTFEDAGEYEFEYEFDGRPVLAAARSPWRGRALIAAVSIFFGVISAHFIPFGESTPPEVKPRVAQNNPAGQAVGELAQDVGTGETLDATNPREIPDSISTRTDSEQPSSDRSTGPDSPNPSTSPGAETSTDTAGDLAGGPTRTDPAQPEVEIDWHASGETGEWGRENPTRVVAPDDMPEAPKGWRMKLRKASARELEGVWTGAAIPLEAITKMTRLLTPNVGRVRVVLMDGEIFEGKLYAVGERQVWIATTLGKMALLEWQIDRVEHILTSEGAALLGANGSQDLAGLRSVRVSTAGGVFYGKLLSQDGDQVTLITEAGARITLSDAQVDAAGRAATHLVDATDAIEEPEVEGK